MRRNWLSVGLMAALALALLTVGAWSYRFEEREMRQETQAQLQAIAQLKVDEVVAWRGERLADAAVLAKSNFFTQCAARWLAKPNAEDAEHILARFRTLQEHYGYHDVLLVDAEGRVRLSLSGYPGALHTGAMEALAAAFRDRRPTLTDLHTEARDPTPHLVAIAPLFAGEGEASTPAGAVFLVSAARQFLYPLIQTWPTASETAETLLVRRDGDAVLFLNDLRHRPDAAMTLRIPLSRTDVPAVMAVLGVEGFVQGRDYRGVKVLAVIKPIPDLPWFLVAKVDEAEALAVWRRESALLLGLFLALTMAVAAAVAVVWQSHRRAHYKALYQAEQALQASEARFHRLAENAQDLIYRYRLVPDRKFEYVSPAATAITGYTPEDHYADPDLGFKIVHPDDRPLLEAMALGEVPFEQPLVFRWVRKDGQTIWTEQRNVPIFDEAGNLVAIEGIARDVTERKRAEEALRKYAQDLETLNRLGLALGQPLSLEEIGHIAWQYLRQLVDCPCFGISLYDASTQTLRAAFMLSDGVPIDPSRFPPLDMSGEGPRRGRAKAIATGQPEIVKDLPAAARQAGGALIIGPPGDERATLSAAYVPMVVRGEVLGLLEVQSYRPNAFGGPEVALLGPVANQIGLALENARALDRLRESEAHYRTLFENVPVGLYRATPSGQILDANPALVRMLGFPDRELLLAVNAADFFVDHADRERQQALLAEEGEVREFEMQLRRADGQVIWVRDTCHTVCGPDGQVLYYEGALRDVTERKRLREQLVQAQKMEAVGRLAGGVAHDFNNLLTAIMGYSHFLLATLGADDPRRKDVEEIRKASDRAASLTRQLLAFSRRQAMQPRVLNLNALVGDLEKMLRRLIGEDIELVTLLAPDLGAVKVDPGQMEQVLLNLLVNAREAMPQGGKLTIETANVILSEEYARLRLEVKPGPYVMVAVSDTGVGMDQETLSHLFEPFFTTKETGTGLGLSTVYGIVKQSDGHVAVYSEPGQGTTFKVYLPRVMEEAKALVREVQVEEELPQGTETVLLAEDDDLVRDLAATALKKAGYTVLEAPTGREALAHGQAHEGPIHLLVTDVVMPGMSGRELWEQLAPLRPGIKVLYTSGYTDNAIVHHRVLDPGTPFLQKPFTPAELVRKVRQVLNA